MRIEALYEELAKEKGLDAWGRLPGAAAAAGHRPARRRRIVWLRRFDEADQTVGRRGLLPAAFKKQVSNYKKIRQQVYDRYFKGIKMPVIPEKIKGKIKRWLFNSHRKLPSYL